ncbi:hypothetical protein FF011L_22540 [Roseimaritima multifibrata]|uniref:Uncharacterized protein n=1 Tax=Roseimaritima multifibrata TaxID=1930274 RepID=A0A517MF22_9BACT|nr:hypothetical protein [Roseimaritima multifibrata]QDS93484.1 hypothetical protein FF011L_22540 [Roseimaritima multifibrata]
MRLPKNTRSSFLTIIASAALLATGCCGPWACGPMACGPVGCGGGCQSGCGERYIDPWINEPASCGDSCDQCGNYNGQSCGSCRPVFGGVASLWGYRYDAGCCDSGCSGGCDGGCDAGPSCGAECGGGDCGCGGGGGGHYHGEQIYSGHPTPVDGSIVEGEVIHEGYQPSRTKQIFRQRGPVVNRSSARHY